MRTILMAAILFGASAAHAQEASDSTIIRVLSTVPDGQPIRVALLRSRWTGAYMGTRGDTVFLGVANQPPMAVRFNAVDTLWRAEPGTRVGVRRGALWGGAVGGVFMGIAAGNFGGAEDVVPVGLVGALVGAGSGALAGALIGSRLRHWRRVYAIPAISPF